jgi:pimeloyl-ACP methyl ester carboxylesterase
VCRGFRYKAAAQGRDIQANWRHLTRVDFGAVTASRHPQREASLGLANGPGPPATPGVSMRFTISHAGNYLRGDMYERKTAEETRQFLLAVAAEALKSAVDRVLISVHSSRPIFRVQGFGLAEFFETIASRPAHRIATIADSYEGQLAQQYVVTLARLRGLNVRSFRSESEAIAWLQAQ